MQPESLNDAYIDAVKALGGSKAVGVALWPAKGVDAAQRHLLACLNPERNEKLSPEEALHIERLARAKGCHVVMEYRAAELGYSRPEPVAAVDRAQELMQRIVETNLINQRLQQRLEALLLANRPEAG